MDNFFSPLENPFDQFYWNKRWENEDTLWDIGYAAPAITHHLGKLTDKNISILIPGCGNAYEAEFLAATGFTNITLIDIAPHAVKRLQVKFAHQPAIKVICEDFFQHQRQYQLIIEQTFFCALAPQLRPIYAFKMAKLLAKGGILTGLLFNKQFTHDGPPFGGDANTYKSLFEPYFVLQVFETCTNSIPQRQGAELFIHFVKK